MFAIDGLILVSAILVLVAIASSKFSSRLGVPVLVLFLVVGMLAGSEGIGGIAFEDYRLAHGIGTVALVLILFDGGLRTPFASLRTAVAPALTLATVGVLLTSFLTGLAAWWLLDLSLLEGMLLGSIAGSTDAAAVFAALRTQGLRLPSRLSATVEVESASNDPMAVFLTIGFIEVILGRMELGGGFLLLFATQMGVGAVVGLLVGWAGSEFLNRIRLAAAGLYPILMTATGFLAFGTAAELGGSGFLAVYLAGVVAGNRRVVFQRGNLLFSDGMAWLAQIVMFVVLGLLTFPSRLWDAAPEGMALAGILVFVARPAAVALTMLPFRFTFREIVFLSWAGLKGAVPVVLAIYPLLFGVPSGALMFDVVFFAVLVSTLAQGWSLPRLARRLGLSLTHVADDPVTLEITSLRDVDGDIVEYSVASTARAAGRLIRDLALPEGAVVAMIVRDRAIIPPRGSTAVLENDHVFLVLRPEVRPLVDRTFSPRPGVESGLPRSTEFRMFAGTTVGDLDEFYGISLSAPRERSLGQLLPDLLGRSAATLGARAELDGIGLVVRGVSKAGVEVVGITLPTGEADEARPAP
ncbi:MAG TPA: potassium/proton antiporter [Longimicrobiales bacterium]|nr:potassium/proton antiporter [Longimicrobiales bacterium]